MNWRKHPVSHFEPESLRSLLCWIEAHRARFAPTILEWSQWSERGRASHRLSIEMPVTYWCGTTISEARNPQASSDMSRSPKPAESFVCQLALSTDFGVQDSLLPFSCGYCKDSAMPESVAAWTKIEHCFSQLYPALSLQQCYFLGGFGSYKSSQKWLLQGVWPITLIKCFPWPSTRDVAVWTRFSRSMASPRPNLCFFSGRASQTPWFGWQGWRNQNPPEVLKAISVQRCGFCDASLGKSSKQVFVREFEDSAQVL